MSINTSFTVTPETFTRDDGEGNPTTRTEYVVVKTTENADTGEKTIIGYGRFNDGRLQDRLAHCQKRLHDAQDDLKFWQDVKLAIENLNE